MANGKLQKPVQCSFNKLDWHADLDEQAWNTNMHQHSICTPLRSIVHAGQVSVCCRFQFAKPYQGYYWVRPADNAWCSHIRKLCCVLSCIVFNCKTGAKAYVVPLSVPHITRKMT